METSSHFDSLAGQVHALATALSSVLAALPPREAATVALQLTIDIESMKQAANRSQQETVTISVLSALRDSAAGPRL